MVKDEIKAISEDKSSSLKKLDDRVRKSTIEREDNLRVLLQLQKRWDDDEKAKEEEIRKIKLIETAKQMEYLMHRAASLIQKNLKKAFCI